MRRLLGKYGRRGMVTVLALALLAPVAVTSAPAAAAGGGPSVPLPTVPTVPVTGQSMGARAQDEASSRALRGDQPVGSPAPPGGGTSGATDLSPSAYWEVSKQSGEFRWSYPLRVPPAPGGLEPDLALSYSSSTVDGRTSATNNQASWVGDGWDLSLGYVERSYGGCSTDKEGGTTPPAVGDLCWKSDNASASYGGGGGALILGANGWRQKNDDGSRIERLTGTGNGDDNGESWKITSVDGTQYFFGSRPEADSTWTVPVYGDDDKEPCHQNTFDASSCTQAWRWNLDKVVDRHGNEMLLSYRKETNKYGQNAKDAAVSYVRGGTLAKIEYGLHTARSLQATGRVVFDVANRCVPGSECVVEKPDNWPDVALKDRCDAATCKDKHVPTFWSTQRLSTITTQVLRGSSYADVDKWTLDQQYPDPGDKEKAALWLKSITQTGLAGGSITLPAVTFEGAKLPNRVAQVDGVGPLIRYRITGIVSESGGVTSIHYESDCTATSLPANAETNTRRCFPVRWNKPGLPERTDWFHKYVVTQVTQSDRISSNPTQLESYEYLGGAAWHYDTSEFTPADKKTWNEFRGFGKVRVRTGTPDDPSGPVTLVEQRFHRGMNGDRARPDGGTKPVEVEDSEGAKYTDDDWLSGSELETITYDGEDKIVSRMVSRPSVRGPTATRGDLKAYIVRPGTSRGFTKLANGKFRITRTETTYDDLGLPIAVNDLGDETTADDDQCKRTTYHRNESKWLVAFPARVQTVATDCDSTPSFPADAVSDSRAGFDGQAPGVAPTTGDVTLDERMKDHPAAGPVYYAHSRTTYDVHGRVLTVTDPLGKVSKASFTPAEGGPATVTTTTNALNHTGTTELDPAWGTPVRSVDVNGRISEVAYDALGRTVELWQPNRLRSKGLGGSAKFTYLIRNDAPTVITASTIGPNGRYTSKNTLYDGLYRVRQVQQPAPGGGRMIADTRYDSQGRAWKSTQPYFTDGEVDTTLWVAADTAVPGLTETWYDGAGRTLETVFKGHGYEKWRSSTRYDGDRVHVTPPQGGVATTTIANARGQVTALRQYHDGTTTGAFDETSYTYTQAGKVASVRDVAGSTWRYNYDAQGRAIRTDDPDKGVTLTTYDLAGHAVTSTDARGVTLSFGYDDLGRRTGVFQGGLDGTKLAEWSYDTATGGKGAVAASTRWVDGQAYVQKVSAYTSLNQPLITSTVIPEVEGALAGTYQSVKKYNDDGSPKGESLPAGGGLPLESMNYTYDDNSRPLTTTGGFDGGTTTYVSDTLYTSLGEAQRIQLGEGTNRAWLSYYFDDNTRRLTRNIVDAETPQPMVADVNYTYDASGNLTQIADRPQDRPADVQCFQHDYLQRMTEAWTPSSGDCGAAPTVAGLGGPAPYWQSFRLDKVGNRVSEVQHTAAGDVTRAYTYPAAGSQEQPHALAAVQTTGGGRDEFAYDAAGNTTTRTVGGSTQQLSWNPEGQLGKIVEGLQSTEYLYEANGTRLIRRDPTGTTLYLGSQEFRLDKASGKVVGTRYYGHGGKPVAVRTGGKLSWLAADHQGTQQIAIAADGLGVQQRRQTPFGGQRGTAAAFPGSKGFVGGTIDESTDLLNLGARQYDPATGRFLSVDPVIDPNNPQQLNAYSYANNSPITYSDPTGQMWGDFFKAIFDIIEEINIAMERAAKRPWYADLTLRHNAVVAESKKKIIAMGPAKIKGFDPKYLKTTGTAIPGGSKAKNGNVGYADIMYDDGTQMYIWEVKSGHAYTPEVVQAEVTGYVTAARAAFRRDVIDTGFALGEDWTFTWKNGRGKDELITVHPGGINPASKGQYPGAILYTYREKEEQPEKPPIRVPAPKADGKKEEPRKVPAPRGGTRGPKMGGPLGIIPLIPDILRGPPPGLSPEEQMKEGFCLFDVAGICDSMRRNPGDMVA